MKLDDYIYKKINHLEKAKLSDLLKETSNSLTQDTSKKLQYNIGTALKYASYKAYEMETAVATDNNILKEHSITNRIKSYIYGAFYENCSKKDLEINNSMNWACTSFKERLALGFVKTTDCRSGEFDSYSVKMLTPEEKRKEFIRVLRMMNKIRQANNLPYIPFSFNDVAGRDHSKEKATFGAYAYKGFVHICPLYTKYMSDNQLAEEISHEIGHIVAGHNVSEYDKNIYHTEKLFRFALRQNNAKSGRFDEKDNETLITGLRRMQEFEADVLGASFMQKAGYKYTKSFDKAKFYFNSLDRVHPSPAERITYIKNYDYSTFNFSYEKRYNELKELKQKINDGNSVEVENYFMSRILKFARFDNQLLKNRIKTIEQGTAIDKIKALPYLKKMKNMKEQEAVPIKSNILRRVYAFNEQRKDKEIREVSDRIESSLTRMDYAQFYLHQAMEANKLELTKSVALHSLKTIVEPSVNIGMTVYNKIKEHRVKNIGNKKQADLGR